MQPSPEPLRAAFIMFRSQTQVQERTPVSAITRILLFGSLPHFFIETSGVPVHGIRRGRTKLLVGRLRSEESRVGYKHSTAASKRKRRMSYPWRASCRGGLQIVSECSPRLSH